MSYDRRICDFTQRPIDSKDRGSVELLFADLDEEGKYTGEVKIVYASGEIRRSGNVDGQLHEYSQTM
jgi:hypothetical protein